MVDGHYLIKREDGYSSMNITQKDGELKYFNGVTASYQYTTIETIPLFVGATLLVPEEML